MKNLLIIACCLLAHFVQAQSQMELLQSLQEGKDYHSISLKNEKDKILGSIGSDFRNDDAARFEFPKDSKEKVSKVVILNNLKKKIITTNANAPKKDDKEEFNPKYLELGYVPYFVKVGNSELFLLYLDEVFFKFDMRSGKKNSDTKGPNIIAAYSLDKGKLNGVKKDKNAAEAKISEYLSKMYAEIEAAKKKLEEEKQEQKSIQNKDIAKIEVVWLTNESETSLGKKIKFAIRATAKDGKVYETIGLDKNAYGVSHDYTLKTDCGCGISYEAIDVPPTIDNIKNDQITLIVQSKHHPNLKPVVASINMAYSQPLEWYYNGGESSGHNGLNKYPIKVYVTESANKKYNLVEAVSFKGEKIGRAKLKKGVNLLINNEGGKGGSSSSSGAGNGGNGGDVTVYYTPGLAIDFLTIINGGGRAYSSRDRGTGRDGLPGKIEKIAQKVNLNF
jgi:hypothetical protein